jgi:hypothetical protein
MYNDHITSKPKHKNIKYLDLLDGDVHNHYFKISRNNKQTQTDILTTE